MRRSICLLKKGHGQDRRQESGKGISAKNKRSPGRLTGRHGSSYFTKFRTGSGKCIPHISPSSSGLLRCNARRSRELGHSRRGWLNPDRRYGGSERFIPLTIHGG